MVYVVYSDQGTGAARHIAGQNMELTNGFQRNTGDKDDLALFIYCSSFTSFTLVMGEKGGCKVVLPNKRLRGEIIRSYSHFGKST